MNNEPGALNLKHVRQRLERAAGHFDQADFVHRHAAAGLFERLAPMQIDASRILNLGSATGRDHRALVKRFRGATVVGADRSMAMLAIASRKRSWFSKSLQFCGDAMRLPLATGSMDLVYANLLLPWLDDLHACFGEIGRVLRRDGLFVFSTLGPDSFLELREAWGAEAAASRVRDFPDMHDVGDVLVKRALRDPVLDVDTLALEYSSTDRLFLDLKRAGAGNSLRGRQRSLTAKSVIRGLCDRLTDSGRKLPFTVSLELIYGHAWGGGPPPLAGEYTIAAGGIGRRRR